MITVRVKYAGLARNKAGLKEEEWYLKENTSLEQLVDLIAARYNWSPEDKEQNIVVCNHHGVSFEDRARYLLRDRDLIQVLSPVSGG